MDTNQYLELFIEESKEHLQILNESLLKLEKNTEDISLLNEIFRVSHTIKGMAATMGYTKVTKLTHEMENLLHVIRNGEVKINSKIIDILFESLDKLEEYIDYINENGEEGDLDTGKLVKSINDIINSKFDFENNLNIDEENIPQIYNHDKYVLNLISKAKEKNLYAFDIDVSLSSKCMLKSARAFIIFNALEKIGEIIQSIPSAEDIEDEKFDLDFTLTIISKLNKEEVKKILLSISEIENIVIQEIESDKNLIEKIEQNNKQIDDSNIKQPSIENNLNKSKESKKMGKTVRVDIDRLDNLMNLVSELIIIKTRMEDKDGIREKQNMNEAIEYLERITTSLHDAVMKVRMVPIERVFNRFPRMVRDLSKELNKEIKLEMSGEDTEVDRTIIDEIGDPLIHLIRNSIDHGVESPEKREKSGKNKTGIVNLRAYPDGNNVVVEVEDDGNGIDADKIRNKSIEKGIITQEIADMLTNEEAINLLFEAGFSTAENITDISGRGVGLDVVKTKIEAIGGTVEVETIKGKGTKFIIRLPLTLAIIQALLVNIRDEIYAIPLSSIKEISPVENKEIRKIQNQEIILFRNKTLPIVRLDKVLGFDDVLIKEQEESIAVIVKKGEKEAALIINDLIGQQEIVIKSLGKYLNSVNHLAGATILGNGEISLILDVNSLF